MIHRRWLDGRPTRLRPRWPGLPALVGLLGLLALPALSACDDSASASQADGEPPAGEAQEAPRLAVRGFDGRIVPTSATPLRAPENAFKLRSWSSSSSWTKLSDIGAEGKAFKAGEVVARFEFNGTRARPGVQDEIDKARAEQAEGALKMRQEIEQLRTDLGRLELDAEQAELDTLKEGAVSERAASLARITHRQADFEVDATRRLIAVQAQRGGAEARFMDISVVRAEAEMERFANIEQRFKVVAPHDGVLRYGFMSRQRRKVEKGDGMPSGYEFASLARDASVSVEFFVPERRRVEIKVGGRVKVLSPVSGAEVEAVVERVDDFPQEIGFLRDNEELPAAREKAFVVRARFEGDATDMKAGLEVKVLP